MTETIIIAAVSITYTDLLHSMALSKPSYIKYAPSWFFLGLLRIIALLPYGLLMFLGKGLGLLIYRLIPSRVKVVGTNLTLCFPELSESQKRQLITTHFKELGLMLVQTIKAFLGQTERLEKTASIEGTEHIENCLKNNKGVLLVAGHFTALDMGGKI